VSHRSAAALWRISRAPVRPVEVTVPGWRGHKIDGIRTHIAAVDAAESTQVDGIPITTPGRTLVDLADVVDRRTLERAFDEAEYLRLDCAGLRPIPGRRGNGRLKAVMESHAVGSTRTRSELEEQFLSFCRSRRLPSPELNAHAEGYEVDAMWRDQRLVVELDGAQAHATRRGFERDRVRADLTAAGWRVIRLTHRRLASEPAAVERLLDGLLVRGQRPARRVLGQLGRQHPGELGS
jgi:very-short-patch-repair endonuclease